MLEFYKARCRTDCDREGILIAASISYPAFRVFDRIVQLIVQQRGLRFKKDIQNQVKTIAFLLKEYV
jgi:hypothetical protein